VATALKFDEPTSSSSRKRIERVCMALRILTGIVSVNVATAPRNGSVTISFSPHALASGPAGATVIELSTIGPVGRFIRTPGKLVALRQVRFLVTDTLISSDEIRMMLNDTLDRDSLIITWDFRTNVPSMVEEISYLVIGEVPDLSRIRSRPRPKAVIQRRTLRKRKKR